MLKQRVATAILLGVPLLAAVVWMVPWAFALLIALLLLVMAREWSNLSGWTSRQAQWIYVGLVAVLLIALSFATELVQGVMTNPLNIDGLVGHILVMAVGFWGLMLLWIQGYPSSSIFWGSRWVRSIIGFFVLVPAWMAMVAVKSVEHGHWLLLWLIAVVVLSDTGAYFAGKKYGKTRLAAHVSPAKTWEGLAGGVFCNLLFALCLALATEFHQGSWWLLVMVAVATTFAAVLGDLLESMIKRFRGVKDSGTLLPGHGGVFDRMDSLTAAAPVFACCIAISGWA